MACFLVPMAQAIATTIYRHTHKDSIYDGKSSVLKRNIPSLEKMLWGGTVMLIVDHIINGELTWRFPFFTAFTEADGVSVFFKELLTVGVPMSLTLTVFWAVWALCTHRTQQLPSAQ